MKKINGISLLHGIATLSGIGIVGIFAWCDESINEGGRGITPTLLFVVYVCCCLLVMRKLLRLTRTSRECLTEQRRSMT